MAIFIYFASKNGPKYITQKRNVNKMTCSQHNITHNWAISRYRQCACVHFMSAICDHKQELLDTVAKHRFVKKISLLSE